MVMGSLRQKTEVAVIGGGPGGYVAALRAADLGKEVLLIEARDRRGGVCLLEGCIPSKALIHVVELARTVREAKKMGLTCKDLRVDPKGLRQWKERVVRGLSKGVDSLLEKRGVDVLHGYARFAGPRSLVLEGAETAYVDFEHCIIATGSRPVQLPVTAAAEVWTSREALELASVPERLLVIGAGYIGLELGFVYAGLGSKVVCVEMLPTILSGMDPDLTAVVAESCRTHFEALLLGAQVERLTRRNGRYVAAIRTPEGTREETFDQVLVAVGRRPNTDDLALDQAGLETDERGLIPTDDQCRTRVPRIYAIGDVREGPPLAHKASREGKVAAEAIAGQPASYDNRAVPMVVFTAPELACTGLTEAAAKAEGRAVKTGVFPLTALGRARTLGRTDGLVKVVADGKSGLVLGVGIVGPHASDLIAEATLAVEMGATLEDLMVTIHPHPTLSEALMEAAEVTAGVCVHLPPAKGRRPAGAQEPASS